MIIHLYYVCKIVKNEFYYGDWRIFLSNCIINKELITEQLIEVHENYILLKYFTFTDILCWIFIFRFEILNILFNYL